MNEMKLPVHWEMLPFAGCLKKVNSKKVPSIKKNDYQESGEFPVIDQGAAFISGWTDSTESVIFDNLPVVIFGDHTRIFKYVDFPFAMGADGTKLLYANDEFMDALFFYYVLLNLKVPNKGYNRHYRYLREFSVVCPPLPEQRAIARILQTIQEAKAARQREISLERERKAVLMEYLFSHGTKGEPRKQTEIGEIPESWEVVELGDLIDVKHGYAFKSEYFVESGDVVLTPGNFLVTGGLYWGAKTKFTSQQFPAEFLFEPGDLVVVMTDLTPTTKLLGASAFIPKGKRILHNQRIGKILLRDNLTSKDFIYWVFNSKSFRKHMALTATGSTVRHTSPGRIKNYSFGLPLNCEQQEIAEILHTCDTKIAALEQEAARLDELFHAMLDELMTGKRPAVPLFDSELP